MAELATGSAGGSSDLWQAMRRRRMHRAFADVPVEAEQLARLAWAGGRAPTARPGIRQLVLVTDPPLVRTIRQVCPGFVNDAPVVIAICSDLDRAEALVGARGCDVIARIDAGAAAAYLSLAAPALGLGICLVTSWSESAVQEVLELPDHVRPEVLVAVGRPAPRPSPTVKATPPIVHLNRFGALWEEEAWIAIRSSSSPSTSSRPQG